MKAGHNLTFGTEKQKGGVIMEIKYHTAEDTTWAPIYTKSRGDTEKTFNTTLPKRVKDALGVPTPSKDAVDKAIDQTNTVLQNLQKQKETQRKALQQAETKAAEAQRLRREMDAIRGRTKDVADRMQELEDTQGPLDKDAIQKLKDEKRKLAADH